MMADRMVDFFEGLRAYRHEATPLDYNFGFFLIFATALTLTTPLTPGWRLLRAGIIGPVICVGFIYLAWIPYIRNDSEQWGVTLLMTAHGLRTLELLVFFPAEENVYRVRAVVDKHLKIQSNGNADPTIKLLPEPIPDPWTFAKFCWGMSLVWSWRGIGWNYCCPWRGIGWNYCCPLPQSSRRHPFTRTSSRRDFLLLRLRNTILLWISWDVFRTISNLTPVANFLTNPGGTAMRYSDLSEMEKAFYSIMVPARIVIDMEKSHLAASILLVSIGGYMGWEGEIWSPHGWPPIFGSFEEIFRYPGLATMWSRTWQGYFRRWLHVLAWIGIGENLLGLTHSGDSARPVTLKAQSNGSALLPPTPSPLASGRTSPSHPLPSVSAEAIHPNLTVKLALSNLAKSIIVFTLSGIVHDFGTYNLLLLNLPNDQPMPHVSKALALTPFFVAQPFGLVAEALLKSRYRKWKTKAYPGWKDGRYPRGLVLAEGVIGFALTWIWLGWSAGWFVEGMTKSGKWNREPGKPVYPSLLGGLVWGKWFH